MIRQRHQQAWTADEDKRLAELYGSTTARKIGEQLNRSRSAIKNRVNILGLTKSSNTGGFKKGNLPWNKGTSYVAGGRSAETRFKPGTRQGKAADLYRPIGTERISKDGYLERKINDDMPFQKRWRAVHILNWEAENGPLPKGYALRFKDGDKVNVGTDNLELISRADLMRKNTIHQYPKEIAQLVQLRGAITRQINKQTRKNHGQ